MSARRRATAERRRANVGTSLLLCLLGCVVACSSPTDVVAVFDPNDTAVEAASSPGPIPDVASDDDADDKAGVVIVLGRPVPKWQGATLDWPLSTPLSKFFAEPEHDSKSDHSKKAQSASSGPRGSALDPHPMNGSDSEPADSPPTMRILDSDGDVAERLKALFAEARRLPGIQQSIVVRDAFDDLYLIVLKDETCGASSGCSAPPGFE